MSSNYTATWEEVKNTVSDRLVDDSLTHTINAARKIKKQTKLLNTKFKQFRSNIRDYEHFLSIKKQVEKTCKNNDETDDEPGLSYETYKKLHNEKPKSELRTFLRSCTQTKWQKYVRKKRIKSIIHNSKKANKSSTVKRTPCPPKAILPKHHVKSTAKTSEIPDSENLQSQLSDTESEPKEREKIIPLSDENTDKKKSIQQVIEDVLSSDGQIDVVDKSWASDSEKSTKQVIEDVLSSDSQIDVVNKSWESDSENVELAAVEDTAIIANLPKELAASEPKYEYVADKTISCFEPENKSIVSNDQRQDNYIPIDDVTDDLNYASNSVLDYREISNVGNPLSQEDIFTTNDEKISLEENLDNQNNYVKYIDALNCDSGNHSFSELEVFREECGSNSVDKAIAFDYCDNVVGTAIQCLSINEYESIPSDDYTVLVNGVIEPNGSVTIVSLDNELNFPQPELRCENSVEEVKLADSIEDYEVSQEIPFAELPCYSQLKGGLSTESTANDSRSKLKIRNIEQFDEGYEIFNEYQLHKWKKLKTVNNSDKNSLENAVPSEAEQLLRSRKSSEDCKLPQSESQHSNGLINHEESFRSEGENTDKSTNNKLLLESEAQSEGNKPYEEYKISEAQSHHLNSSFSSFSARSYDEDFKNSIKTQLLSEIEQRLKDSPISKSRSSHIQSQTLNGPLHNGTENSLLFSDIDDKSIDDLLMVGDDARSLENNRSTKEFNSSEIHLNNFSNLEESLLSSESTPTTRPISSSKKDQIPLENTPRAGKLPRLDKQSTNRKLEFISCERKSQEATSQELRMTKNKDESLIKDTQDLNTSKNVQRKKHKRPRPRNLEEFVATESLTQDITKPHFRLKDIDEDDEVWIMDVPKTINPKDLENQKILLGGKSELRFGDDCYHISSKPAKGIRNVSCIFTTSRRERQYEIVNVKSKGTIKFRQKLSVLPETELILSKVPAVPFPKNLKIRHPLFGAAYEDKI